MCWECVVVDGGREKIEAQFLKIWFFTLDSCPLWSVIRKLKKEAIAVYEYMKAPHQKDGQNFLKPPNCCSCFKLFQSIYFSGEDFLEEYPYFQNVPTSELLLMLFVVVVARVVVVMNILDGALTRVRELRRVGRSLLWHGRVAVLKKTELNFDSTP